MCRAFCYFEPYTNKHVYLPDVMQCILVCEDSLSLSLFFYGLFILSFWSCSPKGVKISML